MKVTYSLIMRVKLLACIILSISTTQVVANDWFANVAAQNTANAAALDATKYAEKLMNDHQGWADAQLQTVNARFDGINGQIGDINRQLADIRNLLVALGSANEQTRAETNGIKAETVAATKRLEESIASASESVSRLEAEQQRYKQAFEEYKDQVIKNEEAKKVHEQRQARFYRSLKELFIKGGLEEDKGMDECFKKACEISPNFCASYGELKKFHDNWNKFMEESNRFEKLFWELLANNVELQNIIDRPVQPVVSGGSANDLLALGAKPAGEL